MHRLLTALAGPVVGREAVALARGRRHYLARVLYGLALFAGLCVVWLAVYGTWQGGAADSIAADSISRRARLGEYLFRLVSFTQLGAIVVLAPAFLCGAVAGDREEGRLDALLTDREIVVGKLVSRALLQLTWVQIE